MKKHIVCFGDSNTHGYCADPNDTASHSNRFDENERWTCRLQKLLGDEYLVLEEGLSGRTTVFDDPIHEGLSGLDYAYPMLMSHESVDMLVIMLGTNDTKERFAACAGAIGVGMERLAQKCAVTPCWSTKPNILIVAPPHIKEGFFDPIMGDGCKEKSEGVAEWYKIVAERNGFGFLDAQGCEFNDIDKMHLTNKGHEQLANRVFEEIKKVI